MPLVAWLQYGSSVAGAAVLAAFAVRALRRLPGGEPTGVPVLSVRDRWRAAVVVGGCAVAGAVQRAAREWAGGGAPARPGDLVAALCFGVGAGLVPGLLLYAAGIRAWRPVPAPDGPGDRGAAAAAGRRRPAGR
ncbi:hypothetical protein [Streptomyces sp. NPDC048665]|uniref:hypothetical protein n=1 Tax=Streptomyces sp. NPDC048665 TaxID=3155490 RepID=UPI00343FC309